MKESGLAVPAGTAAFDAMCFVACWTGWIRAAWGLSAAEGLT